MPTTARYPDRIDDGIHVVGESAPVLHAIAHDLAEAHSRLSSGDPDRDETVHEARRALTRARGLVRLLQPELTGLAKTIDDLLRDTLHELSASRDAAVVTRTCLRLARQTRRRAPKRALERAAALGQAGARDLSPRESPAFASTCGHIDAVREALQRFAGDLNGSVRLSHGLAAMWRATRAAYESAAEHPTAEQMHRWRRRVRHLRTQVALMTHLPGARPDPAFAVRLDRLARALGRHHDLALVVALAVRLPDRGDRRLVRREVRRAEHRLRSRALHLGRQVFHAAQLADDVVH